MTDALRLDEETRRKLTRTSAATLTSQLLKRGYGNTFISGLVPLRPDLRMVGVAFTLRYIPTRADLAGERFADEENAQRRAVETIGPGEVLVIDARGDTGAASFGDILATRIAVRGAAGLVTDGGLRDTPAFRELELPSYTRAAHAVTSYTVPPSAGGQRSHRLRRGRGAARRRDRGRRRRGGRHARPAGP